MDYFAGLDISMDETHVCVLDREGAVVRESKAASTAKAIAGELSKAPSCRRMYRDRTHAPILFHGLNQLGLPVVCVESRQATRRSSRSPPTRAIAMMLVVWRISPELASSSRACEVIARPRAPLSDQRAQEAAGQRVTLENQIRGLAVVFGVRLPRALTTAFIDEALKASEGVAVSPLCGV